MAAAAVVIATVILTNRPPSLLTSILGFLDFRGYAEQPGLDVTKSVAAVQPAGL